jgi:hypothetical protein
MTAVTCLPTAYPVMPKKRRIPQKVEGVGGGAFSIPERVRETSQCEQNKYDTKAKMSIIAPARAP